MRPIRTIIIDDEEGSRCALREHLDADVRIEIIAIAKDGLEASRVIEQLKPDLVFMDIDMPHLSGIDVARNLRQHKPLIIFVTAFDRYALHAFDVNAVDYLLKPVTKDRIEKSLARAQNLLARRAPFAYEKFLQSQESFAHARKISFVDGNDLCIMNMDGISCIETEERYVRVFHDGISHIFEESLASIFLRLDKSLFVYAARGAIINLAHVVQLKRLGLRKFVVILDDPKDKVVLLSRARVDEIKERISNLIN